MALGKLAIRRGYAISRAELGVYSEGLMEFDVTHVLAVMDRLGKRVRAEFESAFPAYPEIEQAVRNSIQARATRITFDQLRPEVKEARRNQLLYESGKAELVPIGDEVKKLLDGKGLAMDRKVLPPAAKQEETCPHCGHRPAPMTSAELRLLADFYSRKTAHALDREKEQDSSCNTPE